jgi:hypothetical protein
MRAGDDTWCHFNSWFLFERYISPIETVHIMDTANVNIVCFRHGLDYCLIAGVAGNASKDQTLKSFRSASDRRRVLFFWSAIPPLSLSEINRGFECVCFLFGFFVVYFLGFAGFTQCTS